MIFHWIGHPFNDMPLELKSYIKDEFEIYDCGNDFSVITQKNVTNAIYCLKKENWEFFSICSNICKNLDKKLITLLIDDQRPNKEQEKTIVIQIDMKQKDSKKKLHETLKQMFKYNQINKSLTFETLNKQFIVESGRRIDIYRIVEYIDAHISSALKEDEIAKSCGYSTPYFSKIFKESVGVSFKDYITNSRIKKAKRLLVDELSEKTETIAYQCGYNDVSYFSRVFKRKTGLTPGQYRKKH